MSEPSTRLGTSASRVERVTVLVGPTVRWLATGQHTPNRSQMPVKGVDGERITRVIAPSGYTGRRGPTDSLCGGVVAS